MTIYLKNIYKIRILILIIFFHNNLICTGLQTDKAQRIVSLAPHITEIICKLGANDRLVGRSTFCRFPPSVRKVESVGGYLNIDFEKIIRLKPDIILQFPNEENRQKFEQLGFKVEDLPNESIEDIIGSIQKVGRILRLENQAKILLKNIQDTLKMVSHNDVKMDKKLAAIFVVGRQPGSLNQLYLAGKNTYLNQIWEICGGVNAFEEVPLRYFSVSKEDFFKKSIDVILEFHPGWNSDTYRIRSEQQVWHVFNHLPAVKKKNILLFTEQFYLIPGPRITQVAIKFAEIIEKIIRVAND